MNPEEKARLKTDEELTQAGVSSFDFTKSFVLVSEILG